MEYSQVQPTTIPVALTIASTRPLEDARFLQVTFPERNFVVVPNANENSQSIALVGDNGKVTILLVYTIDTPDTAAPKQLPLPTIWVVETLMPTTNGESYNVNASPNGTEVAPHSINEMRLPGGATLLLVPCALLLSDAGRLTLLDRVQNAIAQTSGATQRECDTNTSTQRNGVKSSDGDSDGVDPVVDNTISFDSLDAPDAATSRDDSSDLPQQPPLPKFPSLSVKLLDNSGIGRGRPRQKALPLNARQPVDFQTDLFHGQILMLVRPTGDPAVQDPYWNERIFATKKRRLIIQIQGRFQRVPQGVVYAGAEISDPMKLGLLTRGLCKVLLRLVESFNKNIHSSFGDVNDLSEHPHIVAPAYTFFERIVATPPGETPPSMRDGAFDESAESIAQRKKTTSLGEWNTTDTYSFSFYSMYIDLPTWKLVGLPASGDLSLETFWGQSMLRICMYEKTESPSSSSSTTTQHLHAENRYAFSVQMKFLGKHGSADIDDDYSDEEYDDRSVIFWSERPLPSLALRPLPASPSPTTKTMNAGGDATIVLDVSDSQYFDDLATTTSEADMQFFDAVEDHGELDTLSQAAQSVDPTPSPNPPASLPTSPDAMLAALDTKCPFWVDVYSGNRGGGAYFKGFAVRKRRTTQCTFIPERACEEFVNSSSANAEIRKAIKGSFSPRLSASEQLRRSLGLTLFRESADKVAAFQNQPSKLSSFLRRTRPAPTKGLICGFVARALSDRHWVEEYAYVNNRCVAFHRPDKRQAEFLLPLSGISKVEVLNGPEQLQLGQPVLVLTSLGRSVYLMFATDSEAAAWLQVIDKHRVQVGLNDADSMSSIESSTLRLVEIDCSADEFLHKSDMWNFKNRKILNCGKFVFHQPATMSSSLILAERAIQAAVVPDSLDNSEHRRAFLDSAAELKLASVQNLDEKSRLTFFLNVYHTMICHAFLVLGPPDSSLQWISYFNNVAYQVGDDIFSLSELEHCIIRAKMSFPGQFLSRFVIPKSVYAMALSKADFRINFALNCGSLSNPAKILIYKADTLDAQLDEASRMYLSSVTYRRTISGDLELKLPKMCQWFSDDFGSNREDLLNCIEPFLHNDVRKQLDGCRLPQEGRFDMSSCTIRYTSFNFECRPLSL